MPLLGVGVAFTMARRLGQRQRLNLYS
jgi:hypothetical protein